MLLRRFTLGSLALMIGCAGAPPATVSPRSVTPPAPCVGNDTIYRLSAADTVRGFHLPSPTVTVLPSPEFHGSAEIWFLVDPHGQQAADSTRILHAASTRDSLVLARVARGFRFWPGTSGSCAIWAWTWVRISR